MKTKAFLPCLVLFTLFVAGCSKYEEGPAFSLRSKTARLANEWKVEAFLINGVDQTASISGENYLETFDKDGNYSFKSASGDGTGKWEFQEDKEQIKVSGVDSQSSETYFILKLKEKEFWYYVMDGGERYEFHMTEN
ncbi:MAG TPA: lipocalin family protein [Luteibaculaceae bacterium]|nr:lipocalin family protein [Luteibaculaceae bacterium]